MKNILSIFLLVTPISLFGQMQGQMLIDSLLRQVPKCKNDTNKVKVLDLISSRYTRTNMDSAIKYGKMGLELAEQLKWEKGKAISYTRIGAGYTNKSDYATGLDFYLKALKINEILKDTTEIAKILSFIGSNFRYEKNYNKALEYAFKSLELFNKRGDLKYSAIQLGNIGTIYAEIKDGPKTIEYEFKALKILEQLNDSLGIARNLGNIGEYYTDNGYYRTALQYLFVSQNFARAINFKRGVAFNTGNIGICYYSLARETWPTKIQPGSSCAPQPCSSFVLNSRELLDSIMLKDEKDYLKKGIEYLQKGNALSFEINSPDVFVKFSEKLSDAYAFSGNYKSAWELHRQYTFVKDSILATEGKMKIANLESTHELEHKENRIRILNLNAIHEKDTRKLLIGAIVLTLGLAFVAVIYLVRKRQNEKQIADEKINTLLKDQELKSVSKMLEGQENERKRIATDLHDRLGSMLSTVKLYFSSMDEQIDKVLEQNKEQYNKATFLLDEACEEVRKISHNLASGDLAKFGLVAALKQLKRSIEDTGRIKIDLGVFGMEHRLDSTVEIAIYRIIQELMNNILKHAKASQVNIQLTKSDDNLNIVVEDNGVGFDVKAALEKEGLGLKNLESRTNALGGSISYDSGKGRGTTTIIDLPA